MRYIAYNAGHSRKGVNPARTWHVLEADGTEDGRLVARDMIERDAERVTSLLNAEKPT